MGTSLTPLRIKEGTAGTPPAGEVVLYSPDGSALLMKDDAGNITTFGSGGGGGSKISELPSASALTSADLVPIVQGGTTKQTTVGDLRIIDTTRRVTANQTSTSTTYAAVTDLTVASLEPGAYAIRAWLIWQSTAVGTGIGFRVNGVGGTVTQNVGHHYTTTTGTTATTGVADQATVAATFQMLESRAWRANGVDPGPFGGTDTANADQFTMLEAMIVVTATTSLQLQLASETAGTGVSIRTNSYMSLQKAP